MREPRDAREPVAGAAQVDFYVLSTPARDEALRFACRLSEKAWLLGHHVWLRAASPDEAGAIDDLLWTHRQDSFVPHARARPDDAGDDPAPIVIGAERDEPREPDVVINLAADVPPFAALCRRIAEIVSAAPDSREAGRERFRAYRELGLELRSHHV